MPKLYDYFGLVLFFYSMSMSRSMFHASRDGCENKIEITLKDGKVVSCKLKLVQGRNPLRAADQKKFKRVVEVLADEIVQHWVNYFVYHRSIVPKTITKKL